MTKSNESARIAQILNEKQSIAICLPQNPNLDAVASATALYLVLLHTGKQVGISAPDAINPQFGLLGQDKIQSQLSSEDEWKADIIGEKLQNLATTEGISFSKFFMIVRIALAGKKVTPPLNESLEILGKEEVISRFKNFI
jgi:lysyl-tRNA synthetase class I